MHKPDNPVLHRVLVVVPVYNHHEKIALLLQRLNQLQLPCLLLDDGSNPETQAALSRQAQVPSVTDQITLLRYEINRGKGAVICDGLRWANQQGYTHALQIDADGQHDLNDIPKFLAASLADPKSVISGCRRYTEMPTSRRYGRRLTDFWVLIHTWSRDIRDSMCGYRLYPLAETVGLLDKTTVGMRMDFDTDILVRLYWQGLRVQNIPTAIRYHSEIKSHFSPWHDNIRITKMHTRLFFGMLCRIPQLISRKLK